MTKIKRFPVSISVRIGNDGEDDYLAAEPGTDMAKHVEMGETLLVGVYQLVAVHEVTGTATSRVVSKPKK